MNLNGLDEGCQLKNNAYSSQYEKLCGLLQLEPVPVGEPITLANVSVTENTTVAQLTVGLYALTELLDSDWRGDAIDGLLIDSLLVGLDKMLGEHLDRIMVHPQFKQLEAAWRSLDYLVKQTDFDHNIKIKLLSVDQESLAADFENASELKFTKLYQQVYVDEYDTPGGDPFGAIIIDYDFSASPRSVKLLDSLGQLGMSAHCPVITSLSPQFFGKQTMEEVVNIKDLDGYMQRSEYIQWNALREKEHARYIGLTLPKFLLRSPYTSDDFMKGFVYSESVNVTGSENFLWGRSCFALAARMVKSFANHGWLINIRGPDSGGLVTDLPIYHYDAGVGLQAKIPTEIIISEQKEVQLSALGFIGLSVYKNKNVACFFSVNSIQKPQQYDMPEVTANSRINARLPYIFLVSRIAHYLKLIQREQIGATTSRSALEKSMNRWLQTLVTSMNNPSVEQICQFPLRKGSVVVDERPDNPGYYDIRIFIMPHFQVEGMHIELSLVSKMPKLLVKGK